MAARTDNFGDQKRTSEGKPTASSETMHVYGSGDSWGSKRLPKGAEIMRKRAEAGESSDNSYTETGENSKPV